VLFAWIAKMATAQTIVRYVDSWFIAPLGRVVANDACLLCSCHSMLGGTCLLGNRRH
jgi:hypothetical protein